MDSTQVYILTVAWWPWPLLKITGVQESYNFFGNHLSKLSNAFDEIWCSVEVCWSEEPCTHFILIYQYWRERTQLRWRKRKLAGTGNGGGFYLNLQLAISLNDLYSWSQLYNKAKCMPSFSYRILNWFGWNCVCCYDMLMCWCSYQTYFAWFICKGEDHV